MDKIDIYREFSDSVKKLIHINRENLKYHMNLNVNKMKILNEAEFCKEFGTVLIDCGRRTGKTTFIIENSDESSIIIVDTEWRKKDTEKVLKEKNKDVDVKAWYQLRNGDYDMGKKYKTVYVENTLSFDREFSINLIYDHLAFDYETLFVLLGRML